MTIETLCHHQGPHRVKPLIESNIISHVQGALSGRDPPPRGGGHYPGLCSAVWFHCVGGFINREHERHMEWSWWERGGGYGQCTMHS